MGLATDDDIPSESTVVDDKVQDGWEESTVAHKKQHGDKTPPPLAKANGGARATGANGKAARPPASTIRSAAIPAPPAMGRRGSVEARMTSQGRPAMQPPEQLTPPNAEVPQTVSNGTGPLAAQPTMIREPPMQGTATKPATQMARLVVIGGTDRGREFVLTKPETGVGRGTDNEIVLTDIAVSRRHFILTFDGRIFGVRDLGSGNGTILNGQRVGTVPVRDGDQIEIGNTLMRFEHPDGAAAQAPAQGVAGAPPQGQQYPLQPPPQEAPYAPQQAGWASGGPPVAPPVPLPPGAQTFATQLPYGSFGQPPSMPGPPPGPATMQYSQPHQAYAPPPSFPEGTPAYDMSMSDPSATALRATQKKKMILGGVALMGGCILIAVIAALAGGSSSSSHKPGLGAGAGAGGGPGSGPVASAGGGAGGGTGGGPIVTPVGGGTAPLVTPVTPSPSSSASPLASPEPRPVVSPSASPAVVAPSPSPSVAPSPVSSPSPLVKPSLPPSPSVKPSPSPLVKPSPSPVKPSPKPDKPKPSPKPDKPDKPDGDPEPIVSGKAKDLLKQSQAQYKARNFAASAQSLRLAAEQQSGAAADKTRAQANQIAAIGEALTGAAGASGAQAVKLYETALKNDAAVGKSAHAAFIKAKLIDAAKTEASKSIAAGKLENAYAYANMAEKYGGSGDPIVQKVRLALELKAKELYSKGQSSKGEAAKAAWRRILKIVPATSPWYQKAYTAVNAAPSGGVDEDEEQ